MSVLVTRARVIVAAAFVAGLTCSWTEVARGQSPDTRESCATAAEDGQLLRSKNQLREAKARFVTCSQSACPAAVRADCTAWLDEVTRAVPTLAVRVNDDQGHDVTTARLFVDGAAAPADQASGTSFEINPGKHVFRAELADGTSAEEVAIVAAGERNRIVRITVKSTATTQSNGGTETTPPATTPGPASSDSRGVPPAVFVAGGVALVSVGLFLFFQTRAWSDHDRLESTCAPTHRCDPGEVDDAEAKVTAAKISLGVGALALAVGASIFFIDRAQSKPRSARLEVAPTAHGGLVRLSAAW